MDRSAISQLDDINFHLVFVAVCQLLLLQQFGSLALPDAA